MTDFHSLLLHIQQGTDLSEIDAEGLIGQIMEGQVLDEKVKAALLALREKGEALSEVVGAARAMRKHAVTLNKPAGQVVDTCGTGGDGLKTLNISTLAALVVAGAGVPVAKHGNRSITSACGSADLLEQLGVKIDAEPVVVERCLREAQFGFLFAQKFHPAMKAVAPIRKALGVPTIFNLLGPLTNPAGVVHQVIGVADQGKMTLYAQALQALGVERALVVRGVDGQDELSTTGPTEVLEINRKQDPKGVARYTVTPETFGIPKQSLKAIQGGSPEENAKAACALLSGGSGPLRDAVVFNAAAALYVAGVAGDLNAGVAMASEALKRGKAQAVLEKVTQITNDSAS